MTALTCPCPCFRNNSPLTTAAAPWLGGVRRQMGTPTPHSAAMAAFVDDSRYVRARWSW